MTTDMFGDLIQEYDTLKERGHWIFYQDPSSRGSIEEFELSEDYFYIEAEYNDSCSCHPQYITETWTYPSKMLLWSDREIINHFTVVEEKKKQAEQLAEAQRKKKEQERQDAWEKEQLVKLLAKHGLPEA